ncbi:MAG: PEP-CTERM sorting domain-containing protein [Thermoguttaceae bacterium]|nr:PEP-CTERM sorting domain-containing protein [Thermoguttaceae bacterium]
MPELDEGYSWDLAQLYTDGIIALIAPQPSPNEIPEPSTWALLILGAAGLMFWRKK